MPKFEVGDRVIINEDAPRMYDVTKPGSTGTVQERDSSGDYVVDFDHITGDYNGNCFIWEINPKYMDFLNGGKRYEDEEI